MTTFQLLVLIWIALGLITFLLLILFNVRAPYGRHATRAWGPAIDNRWGWFWMELPAVVLMPALALLGPSQKTPYVLLLAGLWLLHYVYRSLIFPFRLRTEGKQMPLAIVFSAIFFNLVNGGLNGYFLGYLATTEMTLLTPQVFIGLALFFGGMYINRRADRMLIALRSKAAGYQIPRGWLFDYISCPNHFGEIVEWAGFAVLAWNLPALSFAVWTFCNLAPRARNHHTWYRQHFADYPRHRKALIPYLW